MSPCHIHAHIVTLPLVRTDTLPENTRYPDRGCDLAPVCIDCPLTVCKHDDPYIGRAARNEAIYRERLSGRTVEFLAKKSNLSTRAIHRVIQQQRDGLPLPKPLEHNNEGQLLTLAELAKKTVIHAPRPWPEMMRYEQ
ncbi:MAG: hypothetical protein IIC09_00005 [Proteobacteria bacterium]|nr:hypothetical protein [Pseudomonadota bacterium]